MKDDIVITKVTDNKFEVVSENTDSLYKMAALLRIVAKIIPEKIDHRMEILTDQFVEILVNDNSPSILARAAVRGQRRARMFNKRGGLITEEGILQLGHKRPSDALSPASHLVKNEEIFSIEILGQPLYPAYQFNIDTGLPWSGISVILNIFSGRLDGWEKVLWFITPNGWLEGDEPIDRITKGDIEPVKRAALDEISPEVH